MSSKFWHISLIKRISTSIFIFKVFEEKPRLKQEVNFERKNPLNMLSMLLDMKLFAECKTFKFQFLLHFWHDDALTTKTRNSVIFPMIVFC